MSRKTVLLILCLPAFAQAQTPAVDTTAWLSDFAQLKSEMAGHYANLDWVIKARGLNPVTLAATAEASIRSAASDADARRAFQTFINAFGDGHLEVRFPITPTSSSPPQPNAAQPRGVCARAGYRSRTQRGGVPFDQLSGFKSIEGWASSFYPAGVLTTDKGKKVGVLRIPTFEDNVFPELCDSAALKLKISQDSICEDDACTGELDRETGNAMTAIVERQLGELKKAGITALIVDITRNGGGTNWADVAARVMTAKPLRGPRVGFIRHEHHLKQRQEQLAGLVQDSASAPARLRPVMRDAIARLKLAITEVQKTCSRESIWTTGKTACDILVKEPPFYATGLLPYAKPGEIGKQANCCELFYPSRYEYHEGVYDGPLFIVVDRGTASAAEEFAAMLADNGVARIVGEPTYGAGCGYTNGGIPATLKHSGARVVMPDCVRYRADGTNEVDGITPDIMIPWRANDTPYLRAKRTLTAIQQNSTNRP